MALRAARRRPLRLHPLKGLQVLQGRLDLRVLRSHQAWAWGRGRTLRLMEDRTWDPMGHLMDRYTGRHMEAHTTSSSTCSTRWASAAQAPVLARGRGHLKDLHRARPKVLPTARLQLPQVDLEGLQARLRPVLRALIRDPTMDPLWALHRATIILWVRL